MIYDIIYNDTSKKFILSLLFEEKPGCKLQTYAFVYFILKTERLNIFFSILVRTAILIKEYGYSKPLIKF